MKSPISFRLGRRLAGAAAAAVAAWSCSLPAQARTFDFQTGNAPIDVIIPAVVPSIFAAVAPSDAPLVLRTTTLLTNAWFDALAPYHATAVGVYSRLPRRPADEGVDDRNRNVAIFYAALPVLESLYPAEKARWAALLQSVGLDPALQSDDLSTPEGIGRAAGLAVVRVREADGMNQLGDAGGRQFNRVPYADTTGYAPVNTADALKDPSRWQPAVVSRGNGIFTDQRFVTPQWAQTLPYSLPPRRPFVVRPPVDSNPKGPGGLARYKAQADTVLAASAQLTDAQKMTAELFNNKIESLGFVALFLSVSQGWSVERFVQYDFLVNLAAFDGGITMWRNKARYDAVRPFSAIRYLYGDNPVTAWGGPGRGTVEIPASQWQAYLGVADHPEYPSGSTCFCAAHAQASRRYLGTDTLGWVVPYARGSSRVEPGITPTADLQLSFPTWSQFETDCGQSRLWGGVHFQAAIDAAVPVCRRVGDLAYDFLTRHIDGTAPAPARVDRR
ncbi:vanadium-dependent haloperoxidase [Rubrivivax albus]|uniref:Phosphatase PAP2 family protein n=1 Tax=Rubrivivax albus TaxID=2499835 RepID=A0A3S2TMY6_9BURK|nr:vanadium-dependent haloperoxidase [Rubrivivax albus]RVT51683.1 hypothetical protein ENE75_12790 [Rubrivivax albus]